jgi:hypothetical protein
MEGDDKKGKKPTYRPTRINQHSYGNDDDDDDDNHRPWDADYYVGRTDYGIYPVDSVDEDDWRLKERTTYRVNIGGDSQGNGSTAYYMIKNNLGAPKIDKKAYKRAMRNRRKNKKCVRHLLFRLFIYLDMLLLFAGVQRGTQEFLQKTVCIGRSRTQRTYGTWNVCFLLC